MSIKWVKVSLVNLDSSSFQVHQFCSDLYLEGTCHIFISFFLVSLEMKEHDMDGKEERRCKRWWGSQVEQERGMGLTESQCLHTADSLHSPHPVGTRCVLSIYILIAVSPFGDLSVRKRVTSFLISLFFFLLVEGNRRGLSLCSHWCFSACIAATTSRTTL